MSTLSVYHQSAPELPSKVLTHAEDISSTLAEVGVRFERWQPSTAVAAGSSAGAVVEAYQSLLDRYAAEQGRVTAQVISYGPGHDAELRAGGLQEQFYPCVELRCCVAGRVLFGLHIGEQVFELLCTKGDLITLPSGSKHWFDLGEKPGLVLICLSAGDERPQASSSGDSIAERFTRLEEWM
jgi:1,2-dihydroxy-3-keto-5-methylthiopentene dioxygenase